MEGRFGYIKDNYNRLTEDILTISEKLGRKVTLLPVTKSGTDEELVALCQLGVTAIGENRPQELKRRGELLLSLGISVELHEIGNLQKNKVRQIIDSVSLIHSLDSIELAREIQKRAEAIGRDVPVLIEINSAEEEEKSGILPKKAEELVKALAEFPRLKLSGLMTMGPVCESSEDIRPYFSLTRRLFEDFGERYGYFGDGILSMGMSDSYKVAIEEGSTLVRVGSMLFRKP